MPTKHLPDRPLARRRKRDLLEEADATDEKMRDLIASGMHRWTERGDPEVVLFVDYFLEQSSFELVRIIRRRSRASETKAVVRRVKRTARTAEEFLEGLAHVFVHAAHNRFHDASARHGDLSDVVRAACFLQLAQAMIADRFALQFEAAGNVSLTRMFRRRARALGRLKLAGVAGQ